MNARGSFVTIVLSTPSTPATGGGQIMASDGRMKISPKFTAADWFRLDRNNEADWPKALDIFTDRMEGRFLRPIRTLRSGKSTGFAMLALDSLLVETLQQFWEGVARTPSKQSAKGCLQLRSEEYFRAFLRGPLFLGGFSRQTARLFYRTVRCGILHQAETEGSSRVNRRGDIVTLRVDRQGIDVHPLKFHDELERAFERYVAILSSPIEDTRRKNFWTKMDHIARKKSSECDFESYRLCKRDTKLRASAW